MNRDEFIANIKSMAHVATIDEVKAYWDKKVQTEADKWGPNDFWTKQAKGRREQALKDFQEGKPVEFYEEWTHFGYGFYGEDLIAHLYSDGTHEISSYGT